MLAGLRQRSFRGTRHLLGSEIFDDDRMRRVCDDPRSLMVPVSPALGELRRRFRVHALGAPMPLAALLAPTHHALIPTAADRQALLVRHDQ